MFRTNTADALRALSAAGHLPEADAKALIAAGFFWRSVQGINRITGLSERATAPPAAMLRPLLRATGMADLAELQRAMEHASGIVRACFNRHIAQDIST